MAIVGEISARLRVGQPAPGHGDVAATVGVRGTTVDVAYTIIVEPRIAVPVLRDPAGIVAGERGMELTAHVVSLPAVAALAVA